MMNITYLFLFASLLGVADGSAEISVQVQLFTDSVALDGSIRLIARSGDPTEPGTELVEVAVSAERTYQMELPRSGRWELSCAGEGVWCPTLQIDSESADQAALLPVFPAVVLSGRVVQPEKADFPPELTVQGWLHLNKNSRPVASFLSTIEIEKDGGFRFTAPAGFLDLRIAAKGWVPAYIWGLEARERTTSLTPLSLRRGGSIAGFVWDSVEELPAEDALVLLAPAGRQRIDATRERLERVAAQVRTNSRGFFQVAGVAPGEYRLEVTAPKRAPRRLEPIGIGEDSEVYLKEDLQLVSPIEVEVILEPPVDPDGKPWQVTLSPQLPDKADQRKITRFAGSGGAAVFSNLAPQEYQLEIEAEGGSTLVSRREQIDHNRTIFAALPLIRVEGAVSLNGKPLRAEIRLGTGQRDTRVIETMNAEGQFQGWTLRPDLKILLVTVTAENPPISRELVFKDPAVNNDTLKLDLALTGEDVRGVVVDERKRPVLGADISAYAGRTRIATSESDREGNFELLALPEGSYHVGARHASKGKSRTVDFDLADGTDPPFLELVLLPRHFVDGVVLSNDQRPVAGARVEFVTVGAVPSAGGQPTDIEGRFRIALAGEPERVVFQVLAPSQMLWSGCRKISDPGLLRLTLPPVPGGTLDLRITSDPDLPPTTGGELLVFTSEGGFLHGSLLMRWRSMAARTADMVPESGESQAGEWLITNVAPGAYAAMWSQAPWWQIAASVCTPGPPLDLEWVELLPGGRAVLSCDLSDFQRKEVE